MLFGRSLRRAGAGPALLACAATGALTLAGCGSSGPSASMAVANPGALGTSGAGATSARPSWASALGAKVTVVAPHSVSPGHGSPAAAIAGEVAAINSRHLAAACAYDEPNSQAACRSQVGKMSAGPLPYSRNFAVGYIVIDGDKAVAGMTGKFCTPGQTPECFTNRDPAAIFSTAKSFSALWTNAITPSNTYSLNPCIKVDGKWYIYASTS